MSEPAYMRLLRGLMHLTEPDAIDGILLGMAVAFGGGVIFFLWWTGN